MNARADITGTVPAAVTRDESRAVFGQVMGLVAFTLGFLALGAYIGRDLSGGWGILAFIASFGCIIGLNIASPRGNEQLAISLLFGLGLLLGLALGPVLSSYVEADPAAVWQAAGATGGFVAALGAVGYATRRDLSPYYRVLLWALLGLVRPAGGRADRGQHLPRRPEHLPLLPPTLRRQQRLTMRRACQQRLTPGAPI